MELNKQELLEKCREMFLMEMVIKTKNSAKNEIKQKAKNIEENIKRNFEEMEIINFYKEADLKDYLDF